MDNPPVICVAPVSPSSREALLRLRVTPPQRDFVGDIAPSLADAERCPGSSPMVILRNERPIGYYRIEANANSIAGRTYDQPAMGLRSFFIDQQWQGQGLATQALKAAIEDLAVRHPAAKLLVLTVNCRNLPALRLYQSARFIDSGELYHGGRSGPQHLLWRTLP